MWYRSRRGENRIDRQKDGITETNIYTHTHTHTHKDGQKDGQTYRQTDG